MFVEEMPNGILSDDLLRARLDDAAHVRNRRR
jgi:hypothetical protein